MNVTNITPEINSIPNLANKNSSLEYTNRTKNSETSKNV